MCFKFSTGSLLFVHTVCMILSIKMTLVNFENSSGIKDTFQSRLDKDVCMCVCMYVCMCTVHMYASIFHKTKV